MGCGNYGAIPLMILYMIVVALIMENLFIAVIIEVLIVLYEGFSNTSNEENAPIKKVDIENFQQAWKEIDKNATGFMQCKYFSQFLCSLEQPLGVINIMILVEKT